MKTRTMVHSCLTGLVASLGMLSAASAPTTEEWSGVARDPGPRAVAIIFINSPTATPAVKLTLRFALLPIAAALWSHTALAGPVDAAHSAASAASGVAARTESAVKRGAKAANGAIERGAKKTGAVVTKTAKKIGLPTGPAASAPAHTQ